MVTTEALLLMVLQLQWRCSSELLLRKVNDKTLTSRTNQKLKRTISLENPSPAIKVEEFQISPTITRISLERLLTNIRKKTRKTLHRRTSKINQLLACERSTSRRRISKSKRKWKCRIITKWANKMISSAEMNPVVFADLDREPVTRGFWRRTSRKKDSIQAKTMISLTLEILTIRPTNPIRNTIPSDLLTPQKKFYTRTE